MSFNPISPQILQEFRAIIPDERLLFQGEDLEKYAHDETEDLNFRPEVVVFPISAEEIASLVKICNTHAVPITPRGAGTGLSGGSLSIHGGLMICLAKMNRLIEIDERNLQ